jgi:hypothetical protein
MDKAERERHHQANLARIARVQQVVGRGDRSRIDHEGTLLERSRLLSEELEAHAATERGLEAFDRLLRQAEESRSPQAREIVAVVTAVWNNRPLPLPSLRAVDQPTGDDLMALLDAYRWARFNLAEHVAGGPRRVGRLLERWATAGA